MDKLRQIDPEAIVCPKDNPCLFSAETKVSYLTLDCMDGVAHVIDLKDVV